MQRRLPLPSFKALWVFDKPCKLAFCFPGSSLTKHTCRHLARDEMHTITEDKWDQEVWGAARAEGTNDKDTANWNLTLFWGLGVGNLRLHNS